MYICSVAESSLSVESNVHSLGNIKLKKEKRHMLPNSVLLFTGSRCCFFTDTQGNLSVQWWSHTYLFTGDRQLY